jgi:hypothetical protein
MIFMHVETILSIITEAGARWAAFGVIGWMVGTDAIGRVVRVLGAGMRRGLRCQWVDQGINDHVSAQRVSVFRGQSRAGRFGRVGTCGGRVSVLGTRFGSVPEKFARSGRASFPSQRSHSLPVPAVCVSIRYASHPAASQKSGPGSADTNDWSSDARVPILATGPAAVLRSRSRSSRPPDGPTRPVRSRTRLNFANHRGTSTVPFFFLCGPNLASVLYRRDAESQRERENHLAADERRLRRIDRSRIFFQIRPNPRDPRQKPLFPLCVSASLRFNRSHSERPSGLTF